VGLVEEWRAGLEAFTRTLLRSSCGELAAVHGLVVLKLRAPAVRPPRCAVAAPEPAQLAG
jgi:hypothetical protein